MDWQASAGWQWPYPQADAPGEDLQVGHVSCQDDTCADICEVREGRWGGYLVPSGWQRPSTGVVMIILQSPSLRHAVMVGTEDWHCGADRSLEHTVLLLDHLC